MSFNVNNIKDSTCDGCYTAASDTIENGDIFYVCYKCKTALCSDCYNVAASLDEDDEVVEVRCPECDEVMYELTQEDLDKPSLYEMFE